MRWLFRRAFWVGTGVSVGFGGAMWIRNRVQRALDRVMPQRLRSEATDGAKRAGSRVRGALTEGRQAMQAREAELRDEYPAGRR